MGFAMLNPSYGSFAASRLLTGKAQRRLHRGSNSGREDSMKSAYGSQVPRPDYELTCVEPGSPMGELMRRYWQPVCTSDELQDLPRKEKLLCEEIVVFRADAARFVAKHDDLLAQQLFLARQSGPRRRARPA